ncbi:hypothetical protein AB2B38_012000 [Balneola sp. MJW-20]|uniref:hypothetical protein n=1 Tax=Gracilimonas aurantiaca TaxID=3234185 RepID=UPI0034670F33
MKIKTILSNTMAAVILFAMVSGFQVESDQGNLTLIDKALGVEQAYAGPCGDAGCDGKAGYCGTVTVIKLFNWRLKKDCSGSTRISSPLID